MALTQVDAGLLNPTNAQYTGFKNRIINGAMAIDQRNAGASYTATTGGLRYGVDRWFIYCLGANLTGQQVAGTNTGTSKAFRITGATGSTGLNFGQRIESLNTSDLASQTVTVTAKIYCSTAVSGAAVYALCPTAQDNYASTTSSFSTSITLNSGLNTISVTGALNSNAVNGVELGISFGNGLGNGVTVDVSSIQLEKGSTATSFDYRPYGTELALCERYFQTSYDIGVAVGAVSSSGATLQTVAGTNYTVFQPYRVRMRTDSTVTTYSPATGASGKVYNSSGSADVTATVNQTGQAGFSWYPTIGTALNINAHWAANSEL